MCAARAQGTTLFDDRVFHKDCMLYSQPDGQRVVRPYAAYRTMVQGRQSPASGGYPRDEQVLMMDVLSHTMALVKVRLRLFDHIMEDHLNLMLHEGRWMMYAQHFYRVGSAVWGLLSRAHGKTGWPAHGLAVHVLQAFVPR